MASGIALCSVLMETLGISYVIPVAECDMKLTTVDKGILSAIGFAGEFCTNYIYIAQKCITFVLCV